MNKYLKEILIEQFRRVGAEKEFTEDYVKKKDWFYNYEWTEEEQKDYEKWLLDYLTKNKKAQGELIGCVTIKKRIARGLQWHMLDYGWKFKQTTK